MMLIFFFFSPDVRFTTVSAHVLLSHAVRSLSKPNKDIY